LVTVVAVTASLALVGAASASAGTVQVRGLQLALGADPNCPADAFGMTGSLVGCWFTDTFVPNPAHPGGTPGGGFQARGTEHFVGCLGLNGNTTCTGEPMGTLHFRFQFSARFDPVTGAEIHGRCQHPVTSGSGVFAGATGVMTFRDDVTSGTAPYRGHLSLGDPSAAVASAAGQSESATLGAGSISQANVLIQ
jgi:hypothetical protein